MTTIAATAPLMIRDAGHADIADIVALVEAAYRGDDSRAGWTTEADMLEGQRVDPVGVAEVISKTASRVLLIDRPLMGSGQAGELIACCHVEKQGDTCYFGMFAVSPPLQGSGIGSQLINAAEGIALREWKCKKMEMTVISIRDDLIPWYERRGYRRSGVFKPFPYGDARFGIPKRDDLRFELLVKTL